MPSSEMNWCGDLQIHSTEILKLAHSGLLPYRRLTGSYLSDDLAGQSASSIGIPETTPRNKPQITRQQSAGLD